MSTVEQAAAIRYAPATPDDVDELVRIAVAINAETPYHLLVEPNVERMHEMIGKLVELPDTYVQIAQLESGEVCGCIAAHAYPSFVSGQLCVGELFWWVSPEFRVGLGFSSPGFRLLRGLEQWAREIGAQWLQLTASTPELERAYEAMGFTKVESDFQKKL